MNRATIIGVALAGVFLTGGRTARAVPGDPAPTAYKLGPGSTFQQGCFEGCACPISEEMDLVGTFTLTFTGFDGLFWNYDVTDVDWNVIANGQLFLQVSGSGTYRFGGEFVAQHQLELDLTVGNDPVEHYDSGLAIGGGNFPQIDIVITMNDFFCYDRVFTIHAHPSCDLDLDGDEDGDDLDILCGVLMGTDTDPGHVARADLNLDGKTDGADIRPFVNAMLQQ